MSTVTHTPASYQLPDPCRPKDIQKFLGIGHVQTYEFLNNPPFHVVRVGRQIFVSRKVFLEWFEGSAP